MTDQVTKYLLFTEMSLGICLTKHYALWFDLRTTCDYLPYGTGRAVLNASEGITNQIAKKKTDETLNIFYI